MQSDIDYTEKHSREKQTRIRFYLCALAVFSCVALFLNLTVIY